MNQIDSIENEIRVWSFQNFGNGLVLGLTRFLGKFILALAVFLIGRFVIRKLGQFLPKTPISGKIDPTVRNFFFKTIILCLYLILGISCVSILGIPIASIITLLASAGVAIGLALQGFFPILPVVLCSCCSARSGLATTLRPVRKRELCKRLVFSTLLFFL